ncbi:MAG: hypothetical protein KGL62_04590 [Bradyrhizobium sp.]|uniref:hypothetical protein n=1 Tax=Bradyrhizobium sp. TaxID=376 RepID=UPI002383C548|nr:hypothetical protein [Bradyrhizobium sp.]MDE2601631.1 hypothetical protein [Bradyrhizobium sp.]
MVYAGLIDKLDLGVADFIVGARPVFGCGGRGSVGTANGYFSKVVNKGGILKEWGSGSKQTRILRPENDQMRDILVTPGNSGERKMFGVAHIEPMAALRKPQGHPQYHPLTGAAACIKQRPDAREMKDR